MSTKRELLFAGGVLSLLIPIGTQAQAGQAQAGPVDQVTVTATRTPTPLSQVGSSVSVVTAQDIQDQQLRTLPELLETIPGLNVVQRGGPGGATSVFMRGANSNHVKVLVDGIDVSDTASTSGTFDFAHLLTSDVERVEVLRGPQSSLYGSDAIGGVINVITRRGSGAFKADASAEGGAFDTNNETAGFRGQGGGFHYAVDLGHYHAGATPVTPLHLLAPGEQRNSDYYDNRTASTKLGLDVSDDLDLGFAGRAIETRLRFTGDDFSSFPAFPAAQQSSSYTQQYYARAQLHLSLLDGRFDQTAGLAYSSDKRQELSWPAAAPDVYHGSRTKFDWRGELTLMKGETLTLGAEHEWERDLSPVSASTDINSGYVQLQSSLGELSNAANVRYDSNSRFGDKTTFRIAPSYLIRQTGTQLKASYGTGFKAPSLDELFHDYPSVGFFANPRLRPESSKGWDLGFEQRLAQGMVRFGATYFHNAIHDLITTDATFTTLANIGHVKIHGVESFAAFKPTRTLSLLADYTYTKAWDEDADQELLRRPRHKAALQADWRPLARLQLTGTLIHLSSWVDGSRDFSIPRLTAPGYTVADVGAAYDLSAKLTVYGRITNLGDARYENPTGYLGPGRGVFVGLRARY